MNPGCKKKVQKRDKLRRKKKRMLKEIRGVGMRYMCKKKGKGCLRHHKGEGILTI